MNRKPNKFSVQVLRRIASTVHRTDPALDPFGVAEAVCGFLAIAPADLNLDAAALIVAVVRDLWR